MIKLFKTLWHQHLFRDRGILPTPKLLWFFLIMAVPITLACFWGFGWKLFFGLNITLALASLMDLWLLPRRNQLACNRSIEAEIERGQAFEVVLLIRNHSSSTIQFRLIDNLPLSFLKPFPIKGEISRGQTLELSYPSQASIRGDYELDKVYFRYQSGLALWEKQVVFPINHRVKVIPDMSEVRGYLTTAQKYLLNHGLKVKRNHIGSGEFAQIRTYVPGDDPRKINWRQTAKLSELMTNVYEPEHGKHVTILIDCGRIMGVELTDGNRLERAFEAALTVAAVALQQGDYVSVLAFSNEIKAYIPPGKRLAHLRTILQGIYNLHFDPVESNYARAFLHLETVQKRRSFLLLFSDLDPFLFEENPPFYLQRVRRKYHFLLMGIADPMTAKWTRTKPIDTRLAMIKSTAQREVLYKKRSIRRWGRMGIQMLEVPEEQLATEAVSHYIEIINRGIL
ncbi:MAG: DUF58 domain-containing protein [Desulfitobacteriaceae bacterium]